MPTIETRDGIFLKIPDGMAPDAPEVREAVMAERAGRRQRREASPEFQAKVQAQRAEDAARMDPTEGMDWLDKTRANVGAGLHSAFTGARQLLGAKVSDADIEEKRARDAALAKSTETGLGPDWLPSAGTALQIAGEAAPTLAIPGGTVLRGAMAGIAGGALQPVKSDESRLTNMAVGGVAGAALPLAIKAGRGIYNAATAPRRAGQKLLTELGDTAEDVVQDVAARGRERASRSAASRAIPETLSEATGSPVAARLESEAGRADNPAWVEFKRGQNRARYEAAQKATEEADLLATREGARDVASGPIREAALGQAGQNQWFHVPAQQAALDVLQSDAGVTPAARTVANLVLSAMDERAGQAITPGRLYELRKLLVSRLEGPAVIGDEMSAAVKGAQRQTMQVIKGIDDALDQASNGQWRHYLSTHSRASRPVDAAEAAQLARDQLSRVGAPELGGVPEVTATGLRQAMKAAEGPASRQHPLALSPSARGGMEDVLEQVTHANEPQKARKLAGTAGGGSQTSLDLGPALARLGDAKGLGLVRWGVEKVMKGANAATQRELTAMLQNPEAAVAALREAARLNRPLTPGERLLVQAVSGAAGSALPQTMMQMR